MPNFSFSVIMLEFYIKGGPKLLFNLDVTVAWWSLALATPFYLLVYAYLDVSFPIRSALGSRLFFVANVEIERGNKLKT